MQQVKQEPIQIYTPTCLDPLKKVIGDYVFFFNPIKYSLFKHVQNSSHTHIDTYKDYIYM